MYYILMYLLLFLLSIITINYVTILPGLIVIIISIIFYTTMIRHYLNSDKSQNDLYNYSLLLFNKEVEYEVDITKSDFKVSKVSWILLILIYFLSDLITLKLSDFSYYVITVINMAFSALVVYPIIVESYLAIKKVSVKTVINYIFKGIFLLFLVNMANAVFLELINAERFASVNQDVIEDLIKVNFYYFAFAGTFVASFYEELIFRGIFFKNIIVKNKWLAYITTFITFSLPHLLTGLINNAGISEFLFLPLYGFMGVIFAYYYRKSNSIFVPMLIHFFNNLISISLIAM